MLFQALKNMITRLFYFMIFLQFIIANNLHAQDKYSGQFSNYVTFLESETKLPVGKHKSFDQKNQLKIEVEYGKKGWINTISIDNGTNVEGLELAASFEEIEWELITEGVWINKIAEKNLQKTDYDGEEILKVHYAGFLLNGKPFDNSFIRNKPLMGPNKRLITGFAIGHENINQGELRLIKISPEQGYGDKKVGSIPANSTLVYFIYKLKETSKP